MDDAATDDPGPLSATELRAVFHSVNDAIFVHDRAGNILDVNRAAVDMYGYSREELRNGDVESISSGEPPYTQENALERLERVVDGETQTFEWQDRDSDGNVSWAEVSLSPAVVDDEIRVLAIVRDIDDRKEAERRFQTLIDNLPGIVYRCRNELGWPMLFVGGQSEELTGYDAETIESGHVSWGEDIVHRDDRDRLQEDVESAIAADEPFEFTYRIRTVDGETRWVWERGQRVDMPRRSAGILEGFITDITDRREYERKLEDQRDNLDVLNQVVRHDIRNDMTVVRGRANLLEEHIEEAGRDDLEAVQEATENAIELTKTARDLSETMLRTEEDIEPVSLSHHLRSPIEKVRSKFEDATVTIENPIPDVQVRGNELLEAVFRNIIQNAIVHNDKAVPKVHISTVLEADSVTVAVADNGPGVPDDRKEEIFGKGEKGLDSSGAGIGLYLVRTLVEQYGGDVRVEDRVKGPESSQPKSDDSDAEGAVFVVELPVVA
jgi:PAS domain S-box-containing protein